MTLAEGQDHPTAQFVIIFRQYLKGNKPIAMINISAEQWIVDDFVVISAIVLTVNDYHKITSTDHRMNYFRKDKLFDNVFEWIC